MKQIITRFFLVSIFLLTIETVFGHLSTENNEIHSKYPSYSILVNGDSIENFNQETKIYRINLPYNTSKLPQISLTNSTNNLDIKVINALNLSGTEKERTAKIIIKSKENSISDSYTFIYRVLPKLDLFLLIGQSNMAGRGTMTFLYLDTLSNVFLLTPNSGMEKACNPLNKYSNIRKDIKIQQVGPGYGFSKKLVSVTGANIGLIVNARGGTSIDSWEKGNSNHYYEKTLSRMKSALKWGSLKAILWHQGEGDSKHPETYMKKLADLVQNLRTDLNSSNVLFVAGEIAYWRNNGNGSTAFNEMINTISTYIPNSTNVSAQGLTPLIDFSDPHFDAKSQLILGERYADKVLESCYSESFRNQSVNK